MEQRGVDLMNEENDKKGPLTTGQIARYCHVTHRGVLKWVESGKLKSYRTPGKHSRVSVEDFLSFLETYKMPIPSELQSNTTLKKILIVDDDRGIVHALQRTLIMENKYQIEMAYDGFEAGKKFMTFQPDLVILDIHIPGLNGYQVYDSIRNDLNKKNTKVLIISGVSEPETVQKIMNMRADGFLQKPFSNEAFNEQVKRILG
jgi:two-component system, OmpR family, response regulator VicR